MNGLYFNLQLGFQFIRMQCISVPPQSSAIIRANENGCAKDQEAMQKKQFINQFVGRNYVYSNILSTLMHILKIIGLLMMLLPPGLQSPSFQASSNA